MKIGDVVIPVGTFQLACGSGRYSHAICVSVEPFIMVSEHGDMKWSCVDIHDVRPLCQASEAIVKVALARIERDKIRDQYLEDERELSEAMKKFTGFKRYQDALDHADSPEMVTKEFPATVQGILDAVATGPNYIILDQYAYTLFAENNELAEQLDPPEEFSFLKRGFVGSLNSVNVWVIMDDISETARVVSVRDQQSFR